MELFENFESSFVKQNNFLKGIIFILVIVMLITAITLLTSRQFFSYKNTDVFRTELTPREVCYESFVRLRDNKSNEYFFSKGLNSAMERAKFKLKVDQVFSPIVFENEKVCKVVTRDENGLRAFDLVYTIDKRHAFGVQIVSVEEIKIDQSQSVYSKKESVK